MAIIKKLKRLHSTIRGAKDNALCIFDKDGNIVGSGRYPSMVPTNPGADNVGKVWMATGASAVGWSAIQSELPEGESGDEGKILFLNDQLDPQWGPQYPTNGSEGDVLTLGETGPEWVPPAGGSLYQHNVFLYGETSGRFFRIILSIISTIDTPFTMNSFKEYLIANNSNKNRISSGFITFTNKFVLIELIKNETDNATILCSGAEISNDTATYTSYGVSYNSLAIEDAVNELI